MTDWMLPVRQRYRTFVAAGMFAERDFLGLSIGKVQTEGGLFMNGCRDRADIRVVAEDAEKMRLPVFPYITVDPQANAGRGLLRDAHVLKQPEPQVCVLHQLHPPS